MTVVPDWDDPEFVSVIVYLLVAIEGAEDWLAERLTAELDDPTVVAALLAGPPDEAPSA